MQRTTVNMHLTITGCNRLNTEIQCNDSDVDTNARHFPPVIFLGGALAMYNCSCHGTGTLRGEVAIERWRCIRALQVWGEKTRADMGDKGKHGGQEKILKGR